MVDTIVRAGRPAEPNGEVAVAQTTSATSATPETRVGPAGQPPETRRARSVRLLHRWLGPAIWALAFAGYCLYYGFPTSRDLITLWIILGLVAMSVGRGAGMVFRLIRDWLPVLVFLYLYDLLRGFSGRLTPHERPQIEVEKAMFGGTVPTVWLQQHLWDPLHPHWYDWVVAMCYLTHFVATLFVGVVLWGFAYHRFRVYMVELMTLTAAGLATYAAYPAVPPWLASAHGVIGPVDRVVGHMFGLLPMANGQSFLERGNGYANEVAAMPSLHGSFPFLLVVFFWPITRRWWLRALLVAYALLMVFTLVYGGEHYLIDIVVGWAYVIVIHVVVQYLSRRHRRKVATRASCAEPSAGPAG